MFAFGVALPTGLLGKVLTNGGRHYLQTGLAESVVFLTVAAFLSYIIKRFNDGQESN